jgi:peptide/nickel transport system substrate-binding protein
VSAYLSHFKGVRIVSTDPLVIETYDDGISQLDAENLVTTWWPQNAQAWHLLAIASISEENGELAYSGDKADANEVEWTSFIAGPSLEILSNNLDQAASESYIPFASAMGDYLDTAEVDARYANLKQFYDVYGHYWIGTGPFYLTEVDTTNKTAVLLRDDGYPDSAAKWAIFGQPMLADVEIDGAGQVVKGQEASFDVYVTFNDEPYPDANLEKVSYLVFDESGTLLTQGEAEKVEEGTFSVVLSGDVTSSFTTGALKLQVVAVSNAVAVPGVGSSEFVVVEP